MKNEPTKLKWYDICNNDNADLLVKLWNQFIKDDEEVANEGDNYGMEYMKIYPNTVEGIMKAYGSDALRFIKDNLSYYDEGGSDYLFSDQWCRLDMSSCEEEFMVSHNSPWEIIKGIIDEVLSGHIDYEAATNRFKKYCVEHQDDFKNEEKED